MWVSECINSSKNSHNLTWNLNPWKFSEISKIFWNLKNSIPNLMKSYTILYNPSPSSNNVGISTTRCVATSTRDSLTNMLSRNGCDFSYRFSLRFLIVSGNYIRFVRNGFTMKRKWREKNEFIEKEKEIWFCSERFEKFLYVFWMWIMKG